jgi:mannose-6-phosphate isomerase-like protein (cupin superfamily)
MIQKEDIKSRECPEKSWGYEEWIVNNDLYCGKRLHFTIPGGKTSMHFHKNKHETMYVESGSFVIKFAPSLEVTEPGSREIILYKGDSIVIPPMTPHQISAYDYLPSVLIEFSTHHEDSDSYRMWR